MDDPTNQRWIKSLRATDSQRPRCVACGRLTARNRMRRKRDVLRVRPFRPRLSTRIDAMSPAELTAAERAIKRAAVERELAVMDREDEAEALREAQDAWDERMAAEAKRVDPFRVRFTYDLDALSRPAMARAMESRAKRRKRERRTLGEDDD